MKALLVGIEDVRLGPARLPGPMGAAGFEVAALCPRGSLLSSTAHLDRWFEMPHARSWLRLAESVRQAVDAWKPDLLVPADEQTVALLQFLIRNARRTGYDRWPEAARRAVDLAVGPAEKFDALLRKNETQLLAGRLGVRVPAGAAVANYPQAHDIAARLGYPVVIKLSFSWAGRGVRICNDEVALERAVSEMAVDRGLGLKQNALWLLSREWYPRDGALWLQQAIQGSPAFYTAVAHRGRMLAGFGARVLATNGSATGPSTLLELCPHPEMEEASRLMIEALGASGFISFDFMVESASQRAYLLECNPRPNQVSHLGPRVGVDLCKALRDALKAPAAVTGRALAPQGSERVALFPGEWQRQRANPESDKIHHDVPWDDAPLLAALVDELRKAELPTGKPAAARLATEFRDLAHYSLQRLM